MSVADQVARAYTQGYHDGVKASPGIDGAKGFYVVPVAPDHLMPGRSVVGTVLGWGVVLVAVLAVLAIVAAIVGVAVRVAVGS